MMEPLNPSFLSFRQPQGSYIVSAQPESSEFNITQLRTTQELKVGPRPLGAADVSTYVGLIVTVATLIHYITSLVPRKETKKESEYVH